MENEAENKSQPTQEPETDKNSKVACGDKASVMSKPVPSPD